MAINGQNQFPVMNNQGGLTFPSCETDMCNAHAGAGFDYHYHGDPYGPQCLYSCANYTTLTSHPPLIGYGFDGIPIFGRYLDAGAVGASVSLDDCGGHSHAGVSGGSGAASQYFGDSIYHYHAFVETISSLNVASYSYTAPVYGPFMCWKGNISAIPFFWEQGVNPVSRTDYTDPIGIIKPCAGSGTSSLYLANGMSMLSQTGTGFDWTTLPYTTGAGSTGGACAAVVAAASPPPSPAGVMSSSPPPPSPAVALVALKVTLSGYSVATFNTAAQAAFSAAVAATLGISASAVTVTSVTAPVGRHLLQASGVVVAFTVSTTLSTAAASSTLSSGTTFATALSSAFVASSLTVPLPTSVNVAAAPPPASSGGARRGGAGALLAALAAASIL